MYFGHLYIFFGHVYNIDLGNQDGDIVPASRSGNPLYLSVACSNSRKSVLRKSVLTCSIKSLLYWLFRTCACKNVVADDGERREFICYFLEVIFIVFELAPAKMSLPMMARDAKTSNCSACAKCSSSSPCARSCRQKPGAHVDREDKDMQSMDTRTQRHTQRHTQRRRHTQRHTKRHQVTHQVRHDIHIISRYKRDTHHIKIQAGQKLGKSVLKAL
jgi:hypothetical protein